MPNFLALRYVVTTTGTNYRTFRAALTTLDRIAELKGIDAMVCDAANMRLSERFMARMGWELHKPQCWHRNYIRRFYGVYPSKGGVVDVLAKPQASRDVNLDDSRMVAALSR